MSSILATATAVPPHRLDQATAKREMLQLCAGHPHLERLIPLFDRSGVESRYVVRPTEWYVEGRSFDERNREYVDRGLELAEQAVRDCLATARCEPAAIDHLFFVTTTGLATPSLDARLAARLALRADVRRWPLFGLGCAGGAGALVRANDVLRGGDGGLALVVSVELCSLVFSRRALTATDLVGVALFGDGAAAALVSARASAGVEITAARTRLFDGTQHLMGWDFTSDGMRLVLARDIPEFVCTQVAPVVREFLDTAGVPLPRVTHHVLHPGGPKVMATYRSALGLSEASLSVARGSMRRYGNLSSAAVLFMLHDVLTSGRPVAGDAGLMLALGPGFAAEMLALSW
jgi:alkylresorcinol/alkylpyrone synthase